MSPIHMTSTIHTTTIKCGAARRKRFDTGVAGHITKTMSDHALSIVGQRVRIILEILFLSSNLFSETCMGNGTTTAVADGIPPATVYT